MLDGFAFDTGPSLLTMPWVFRDLLGDACPELVRVEPVTRYRFADGSSVDLSADLPRALDALEAWSPGAGGDWAAFLGVCAQMWRASEPFLTGEPPWPPRRDAVSADPRDFLRVRPWRTLRGLARSTVRDPRLRMVVERFATYAGADPRRAPAALAVAGYVEHAFGAWHVRGGIYELVRALAARVGELGGTIEYGAPVTALERRGHRVVAAGGVTADWVVWNGDALALERLLGGATRRRPRERSLSGLVLLLGVRGPTEGIAHHTISFPRDYDAEFEDVFVRRRPARDPALYVSVSSVTDPSEAPEGGENWFVLVNAPAGATGVDWAAEEERVLALLAERGLDPSGRVVARASRTPGRPRARDRRGRRRDLRRRAARPPRDDREAGPPRARCREPPARRRHRPSRRRAPAGRPLGRARREDRGPRVSLDPPPEPPPGADLPPGDPHFRKRGGPLTTPGGQPKTGAPERRRRRERVIVMTFLWSCAAIAIAGVLIVLL